MVPEEFIPTETHEQYINALNKLGLSSSALGQEWIEASEKALSKPMNIESPYAENFYFDPSKANSLGYKVSIKKGQKIRIEVNMESNEDLKTFLDVFRIENAETGIFHKIASSHDQETQLVIESNIDTEYIIRFQTELLRGGNFSISIQTGPSLAFPVSGRNNSDIGSLFGAPRDGGRRKHHGIDIFAKRHTPIIAPTDGYIRFAGNRGLGGTVIWMRDEERRQTLYFAHLQELLVEKGDYVSIGDTIGTVGNTGNARTTPPHLHFGIYQNGPKDPYHYVAYTRTKPKRELADHSKVGLTLRTKNDTQLKLNGTTNSASSLSLKKHQILEVIGSTSTFYRVRLPDEQEGYISYNQLESLDEEIRVVSSDKTIALLDNPLEDAHNIKELEGKDRLRVLGKDKNFQLVENSEGLIGWMKAI